MTINIEYSQSFSLEGTTKKKNWETYAYVYNELEETEGIHTSKYMYTFIYK